MRFDTYVANKFQISRNKASELIKSGKIALNGEICNKASFDFQDGEVKLLDEIYVGRGAIKLKSFLAQNDFEISGLDALDLGSSTGGFMQILLENGVKSVCGVDVGTSQLDAKLRADSRVRIHENTDARDFLAEQKFGLITCDVSFISLHEILPSIDANADTNALIIVLFKPQFEVGKEAKRNKKGVVMDKNAIISAQKNFELACAKLGWLPRAMAQSQLKGKEGNVEFFYAFNKA
ncbi:MAG: TlyA family RNA methyltransferase [Campylobacter sp.]|nr:TlyA family RNA methyltransferase [Campylobacter sp.]